MWKAQNRSEIFHFICYHCLHDSGLQLSAVPLKFSFLQYVKDEGRCTDVHEMLLSGLII